MTGAWIRYSPQLDARLADRLLDPEALLARGPGQHALVVPELVPGELRLTVYAAATVPQRIGARFTAPRSASLAEREWNLICHARRHGLGTSEPIAVGAEGRGLFRQRSFLITRPPRSVLSLAEWARAPLPPEARARGAKALLAAVERVAECGLVLPGLCADDILLSAEEALGIEPANGEHCGPPGGLRREILPSVYLARFTGARIGARLGRSRRKLLRLRVERELRLHMRGHG